MKLSKVSLNQDILLAGSDLPKLDPIRVCVCVCAGGGVCCTRRLPYHRDGKPLGWLSVFFSHCVMLLQEGHKFSFCISQHLHPQPCVKLASTSRPLSAPALLITLGHGKELLNFEWK